MFAVGRCIARAASHRPRCLPGARPDPAPAPIVVDPQLSVTIDSVARVSNAALIAEGDEELDVLLDELQKHGHKITATVEYEKFKSAQAGPRTRSRSSTA